MHHIDGGELEDLEILSYMKNVEFLKLIGKRTYREVYKLKWMELLCATKKIEIDYNKSFIKEVSILVSLSHPNLISYYFPIKDITNERSGYCGPKIKKNMYIWGWNWCK